MVGNAKKTLHRQRQRRNAHATQPHHSRRLLQGLADLARSQRRFHPYLVAYKDRQGRSIKNDVESDWLVPAFGEAFRVLKPDSLCVSFYGWSKTDLFYAAWKAAGFRIVGHITFPKRYASTTRLMRYSHENAYLLSKGNPRTPSHPIGDVIDWRYSGNKLHPTQKPLSVLTPLIESFCPRSGLVLDPFAGSGSTLIAARSVGRHFLGIELDPQFHAVASQRMACYTERLGEYVDFERQANTSFDCAVSA
jgi:site-specific DNA-methyltransferase (adenine-specific)